MREIKFRLLSPEGVVVGYEKWYPGMFDGRGVPKAEPQWLYSHDGKYWNPEAVWHTKKNQFTGLHDKNGKEIYEGDILQVDGWKELQKVIWHRWGAWHLSGGAYELGFFNPHISMEVIGNIWEHPELLQKGQE